MIDYLAIGVRIKAARRQKAITQETLAERLDISVTYASKIERGIAKISLKRLVSIAECLEVSPAYFLTGTTFASAEYLKSDVFDMMKSCTPDKKRLLMRIMKAIIESKDL